jgi:hypothetical protein
VIGKIGFDNLGQPRGRHYSGARASDSGLLPIGPSARVHARLYQPLRARRLVMWAV